MEEIKKEQKGTRLKVYFTSDLHFSHTSILYFHPARREAAGITLEELQADKKAAIEKHDEWLIKLWNDTVRREDFVYILGDFCLGNRERTQKILSKLHGRKYLIEGNHDKSLHGLENYFEWYGQIKEAKFNNNQYPFIDPNETFCVEMCHFPMLTWNRRTNGTCMIHGHCHNSLTNFNNNSGELRVDVGIDSDIAHLNLVPLETLYKHFKSIINAAGCKTFQEYNELLMEKQGYRA